MRKLRYLGRKPLPIDLAMPWLSETATIGREGLCVCPDVDAERLLETNPKMFADLGEMELFTNPTEEAKTPVEAKDEPEPKTTQKQKKKVEKE